MHLKKRCNIKCAKSVLISISVSHIHIKVFSKSRFFQVYKIFSARCLQFVAGLGPRKADGLIKHYKRANTRLETLDQLISDKGIAMRKFGKFLSDAIIAGLILFQFLSIVLDSSKLTQQKWAILGPIFTLKFWTVPEFIRSTTHGHVKWLLMPCAMKMMT